MKLSYGSLLVVCLTSITYANTPENKKNTLCFTYKLKRRSSDNDQNWNMIINQTRILTQNTIGNFPSPALAHYINFITTIEKDGSFKRSVKVKRQHTSEQPNQTQCREYFSNSEKIVLTFLLRCDHRLSSHSLEYFKSKKKEIHKYVALLCNQDRSYFDANRLRPYASIGIYSDQVTGLLDPASDEDADSESA